MNAMSLQAIFAGTYNAILTYRARYRAMLSKRCRKGIISMARTLPELSLHNILLNDEK